MHGDSRSIISKDATFLICEVLKYGCIELFVLNPEKGIKHKIGMNNSTQTILSEKGFTVLQYYT